MKTLEAVALAAVSGTASAEATLRRARRRALALADLDPAGSVAAAQFVREFFNGLWLDANWRQAEAAALLNAFADASGVSATALGLAVLEHPMLLQIPPDLAVEAHAEMLLAFSGARHVSLWRADSRGGLWCQTRAGAQRTPPGARTLANVAIGGGTSPVAVDGTLVAASILRWQQPDAVILAHAPADAVATVRVFIERSAEVLAPVLEREAMLDRGMRAEQAIAGATERRLARLGLDLHDGPLQSVVAAWQELEQCRDRLPGAITAEPERERVAGWLEDLKARLVMIEAELRDYSSSLGSPGIMRRPLAESLEELAASFRAQTPIRVRLSITGDVRRLSQSQQIALLRIVQEGLNNVRAHSGASSVNIVVSSKRDSVTASVTDDGCGFDPERTLVRAASSGRQGLLGMDERVRLLGGTFRIRSGEGGPTQLKVTLPRWDPDVVPAIVRNSTGSFGGR